MPFTRVTDIHPMLPLVLVVVGMFLWLITYYFIIRKGFEDASYGIPWAAVCLNFASEFYIGFICCPRCPGSGAGICKSAVGFDLALVRAWFLLDVVLLYQVFRHGHEYQPHNTLRRHFPVVILFALTLAYQGRITFIPSLLDFNGQIDAWMLNLVMSVLFVLMVLYRSPSFGRAGAKMTDSEGTRFIGVRGLSLKAGYTRFAANFCIALGLTLSGTLATSGREAFYYYLFVACLVFDGTYIYLLHQSDWSSQDGWRGLLRD